ncbi:MAG: 3-keto-5-aminohexanoate cleavage protein, partial [Litoreibacter sp.]|nr:3-keto-5-aminohexanoate cleavage protein [Litoreibacter sp.]
HLFEAFQIECHERGVAVQHILYDIDDCESLARYLPSNLFRDAAMQLIFVLGRYSGQGASGAHDLDPFLEWLRSKEITPDWSVCAFGKAEAAALIYASQRGGKCRIGFENSLYLPNGRLARDNAEKVSAFVAERTKALHQKEAR